MNDNVVHTDDLTKTYGARRAVDRVTMTVKRGEVYGFLGPNGAGKTTTLRMVLGLVRPTGGAVRVLGSLAGSPEVSGRVGALIEGPGFYPYLSGEANLRVVARYRGLPASETFSALERVGLTGRAGDKFKSYSLGMKQRLGVAAALMGEPELVVLDEPTNGLDPAGVADMRRLIVDLAAGGQTVLLSSHLLAEVQEICNRVGVVSQGRLLRESTVSGLRGGTALRVRAAPLERALAIAVAVAGEDAVSVQDNHLLLGVPASRAPEVTRELVRGGADVHEVTTAERTLEEVFFEITASAATDMEVAR